MGAGSQPLDLTVLGQFPVAPPPESAANLTLPLTFLDLLWLRVNPVHRLIFHHHPISKTDFIDTLFPLMKSSLSKTLQHYSPFAGKLIVSSDNSILPVIRYVDGNSVPLVLAESTLTEGDFDHLVSNSAKSCADSHPLVPKLPPPSRNFDGSTLVPLLALQVTLFPNVGFCIGVTFHHVVGDGKTIFGFWKTWAFFSGDGDQKVKPDSLPFFDRTELKEGRGRLEAIFWENQKNVKIEDTLVDLLPTVKNKVRSTFTLTRGDIQRLKSHVMARRPELAHVTSFTVTCSYVWNCVIRYRHVAGVYANDDEDELFCCAADCRARLDPPLPENYFGNCVTPCYGYAKVKEHVGDDGLAAAATVVGEIIRGQLYNKDKEGVLKGAEDWITLLSTINMDRTLTVAASPKFDYYGLDFGWGKPIKSEITSTDITGAISLSGSKDEEGALEIGMALPVTQMDAFTKFFEEGLKAL
ncbi:unnamed protein product [Cuscuta epithymum]|uniref:Uncharacterized protein n=1 Tax=Cuscuta epithymum TaxID=186058 RepID=A0AAV0EU30_9ASTE|nr:unnamed protein product [Cuscuta epithymum]